MLLADVEYRHRMGCQVNSFKVNSMLLLYVANIYIHISYTASLNFDFVFISPSSSGTCCFFPDLV